MDSRHFTVHIRLLSSHVPHYPARLRCVTVMARLYLVSPERMLSQWEVHQLRVTLVLLSHRQRISSLILWMGTAKLGEPVNLI